MSKKKSMPRSTMSLKAFHGGSIPSDLQLPSAPGMTVDRGAYERPGVWSNNQMAKGYGGDRGGSYHHRQGPGVVNGIRAFEDRASSYIPNTATMGRNYDEDERRPIDHRPRSSPVGHEADMYDRGGYRHHSAEYDNCGMYYKPDLSHFSPYSASGRFGQQPPMSAPPSAAPPEPPFNAWAARNFRGDRVEPDAAATSPWRVRNNLARIAEASAIDKVSSGRWQPISSDTLVSRKETAGDGDSRKVETLRVSPDMDQDLDGRSYQYDSCAVARNNSDIGKEGTGWEACRMGNTAERFNYEQVERNDSFRRGLEHTYSALAESTVEDRFSNTMPGCYDCLEVHYGQSEDGRCSTDAAASHRQHASECTDIRAINHEKAQRQSSGDTERDKTSAAALAGSSYSDSAQGGGAALLRSNSGERPKLKLLPRSKPVDDQHDSAEVAEEDRTGRREKESFDTGEQIQQIEHDTYRTLERPKLCLKPRTLAHEAAGSGKERQSLFGGARPRELVLKERGVDNVGTTSDGKLGEVRPTETPQGRNNNEGGKVVSRKEQDPIRSEGDRHEIRRDLNRQDRRDHQDARGDIDRQESWRRAEPFSALSALTDIPSRTAGKSYGSSALQLAQAFSRSTTISHGGSRLTDSPTASYNGLPSAQQRAGGKHSSTSAW